MEKIIFEDYPSTNTPLNAENLNQIQENVEEAIEEEKNKFNYSTEEQIIGKWIDGKTLYRKVILTDETILADVNLQIPHGIIDYDKIWVDLGNSFYYNLDSNHRSLPLIQTFYTTTSSTERAHVYLEGDYIFLVSNGGWGNSWQKIITLNYTKTTD